jgi:predicted porin
MRKAFIPIALGLTLLSMSAAQAQGYLGVGAGWANINVDCSDVERCDKSSTGGKLYGGYRLGGGWAVEAVYVDWGKATASFTDTLLAGPDRAVPLQVSPPSSITVDAKLRATGMGIGVAYFVPFTSDWNGALRFGVMSNKGKLTVTATSGNSTASDSATKTAAFAYFGVGVGYNLTPNLAIVGEADFSRVKWGAEGEYETDNVRLVSLGLRYTF